MKPFRLLIAKTFLRSLQLVAGEAVEAVPHEAAVAVVVPGTLEKGIKTIRIKVSQGDQRDTLQIPARTVAIAIINSLRTLGIVLNLLPVQWSTRWQTEPEVPASLGKIQMTIDHGKLIMTLFSRQ